MIIFMINVSKKDQQKECRNLVDDGFSTLLEKICASIP